MTADNRFDDPPAGEPLAADNRFADHVPLDNIPELGPDLGRDELMADTMEFEPIARRPAPRRRGLKLAVLLIVIAAAAFGAWYLWGGKLIGRGGR